MYRNLHVCVTCSLNLLPDCSAALVALRSVQGSGDAVLSISLHHQGHMERILIISPAWKDIMLQLGKVREIYYLLWK